MPRTPVAKRLVFHIGGYDPITSHASAQRRFVREIARFQRTWSVKAIVDGLRDTADQIQWNVTTTGPNWLVETDYHLVRWHDVIEAFGHRSIGSRISVGILAFLDFVLAGTLWRYLLTNWRYAGFFLYPFVMFGLFIAAAFLIGVFAFKISGSVSIAIGSGLFGFAAVLAGPWRWLNLGDLFDDWIFSREYIRNGNSDIEQRLDRLATELAAAASNSAADEILVIGHSLGAVLAVDLLDRALKLDPALGRNKIPVTFLSVGSSILKIGLHPKAIRFRAAMERVAKSRAIFWGDYQALVDPLSFYKSRPMAEMGLSTENEATVRVVRLSRMLDHDMYRRIRLHFFRLHCQFVSGNDKRTSYDYFMLVCGPVSAKSQTLAPDGAMSMIGDDGALVTGAPLPGSEMSGSPGAAA
jgi:pimeloyl-ACP methyl ester carboxylesterase